jgi:hypothetical protein
MARGWESKSIESQQEEAVRDRPRKPALTPQQQVDAVRRHTLELSRIRATQDLSRVTSPQHRQMLERTISALDEQLAQLPVL